jgi:hypothetical protein
MIESRCGILCSRCKYKDEVGCAGCINIDKPFRGDSCPVKHCCERQGTLHCGLCSDFPCALLNEFAYDKEQGDGGLRIEQCRLWYAKQFMTDVAGQNAEALPSYFAPDAVICWHDSNEQFTVSEYVRANCEYPGKWKGEVQRIEKIDGGMVMVTKIYSDESTHFVTAFVKMAHGKICRLDEYYSDCGEAPDWRKAMKIGKPINIDGGQANE